jgi:hypothetical protein
MDFSQALLEAKNGKAIRRKGWNATNQFVYHVSEGAYDVKTGVAEQYFGAEAKVPYTAYMAIKTVQDKVAPWLASQTDLLANDWEVVDLEALKEAQAEPEPTE